MTRDTPHKDGLLAAGFLMMLAIAIGLLVMVVLFVFW